MSTVLTDEMIVDWLREREANARRIGSLKQGADRRGWQEDERYFRQAAAAIEHYRARFECVLKQQKETLAQLAEATK